MNPRDAARRRLVGSDGVAIGFLATVSARGEPRLAPVCPIFFGDHIYINAVGHTRKVDELRNQRAYALHAFLGENDEEIQVGGTATETSRRLRTTLPHLKCARRRGRCLM